MALRLNRCYVTHNTYGPGKRVVIAVQGCTHRCTDCEHMELWPLMGGKSKDNEVLLDFIGHNEVDGISLAGGEPLLQARDVNAFLSEFHARYPKKNIWLYTAFTTEELLACCHDDATVANVIKLCHVVVTGPVVRKMFNKHALYRNSSNRTINQVGFTKTGELILTNITEKVDATVNPYS